MKTDADIIQYIMESEMSETVKTVFCELVSQSRRNREQLETLTEFARRQGWLENSESTRIVGRVIWQAEQLRASRDEAVKALEEARHDSRWLREMLADYKIEYDDHGNGRRSALNFFIHKLRESLITATARLAEAERDGKRLDWLAEAAYHRDDQRIVFQWLTTENPTEFIRLTLEHVIPLDDFHASPTLRAAIDQATAAAREG